MVAGPLLTLDDVRWIEFPGRSAEDRMIVPMEAERDVPFTVRRVFTITASRQDLVGGRHGHRLCQQLLVCLHGVCEVRCIADDPAETRSFILDRPDRGVLIPPSIWGEQHYRSRETVLMVMCDQYYAADDYLRDFDQYLAYRRSLAG